MLLAQLFGLHLLSDLKEDLWGQTQLNNRWNHIDIYRKFYFFAIIAFQLEMPEIQKAS